MFPDAVDPNAQPADSSAAAPPEVPSKSAEDASTDTEPAAPAQGTPEADAAAIALFDEAMASDPDVAPPAEPAKPAAEAKPAEDEQSPPEGQVAPEGQVPPVEAQAPPADEAADAKIEKEIADLRLKGSPAARFRELSHQVRELSALRDEEVPRLKEVERLHTQWQGLVSDSTATAPQLEQALAYIQSVNSGDPERLALAAKAMMAEVTWAYKKLGWELPGVVDPLEDHPDLATAVDEGDMTRKGALEVAAARARETVNAARTKTTNAEDDYAAAMAAVGPQIDALSDRLKKSDPAFLAKLPHLRPTVDLIKQTLHPSRWPEAIERAYRALPAPAAPAPRPGPVRPMPLRPTGGGNAGTATVRKFTKEQVDAGDPFDLGVREASG